VLHRLRTSYDSASDIIFKKHTMDTGSRESRVGMASGALGLGEHHRTSRRQGDPRPVSKGKI
jgi:hypothetical protein